MHEFTTAAKSAAAAEDGDVFGEDMMVKIDGRETWFVPPNEGQMALMLATDTMPFTGRISTGINFFFSMLRDENDKIHYRSRMLDRDDPFGAEMVAEVVLYLVEEWTGNPTEQPSDSTSSQPRGGQKSTAKRQREASTRSA